MMRAVSIAPRYPGTAKGESRTADRLFRLRPPAHAVNRWPAATDCLEERGLASCSPLPGFAGRGVGGEGSAAQPPLTPNPSPSQSRGRGEEEGRLGPGSEREGYA